MSNSTPTSSKGTWPDYRAVWRWHFYASLFCIPFVVILSASGAIYLFKPQIEAWNDRAYDSLAITDQPASAADQILAAVSAMPGSTLSSYELPESPTSATRVIVRHQGEAIRVYVHPETLAVLHTIPENERFMRLLFRLHGELLMGDRGSNVVELAASWTIIMILTGLYLWWPRQAKGLGGILYPRLRFGSRTFWRDLHSVTGIWISALALFLLASGLPWAKSWGEYFKKVRALTGTAVAKQDWSTGSSGGRSGSMGGSGGHGDHGGGRGLSDESPLPEDLSAVDRIVATVQPLDLQPPVVIAPPRKGSTHWTAKSMTANRPQRVNLVVDGSNGEIVSREDFGDRHLVDRIVGTCIAAHEGQLFGWPNQLLGLLTALGLILLCISGVVLWWRRRDQGVLGAPKALLNPRVSAGLIVLVVLLGIYLPMFGVSLLVVLIIEKLILRRIAKVRDWLGLSRPESRVGVSTFMVAVAALGLTISGCGVQSVSGGTPGTLQGNGTPLSDIQVNVHQLEAGAYRPIGFAVTDNEGRFELVTNGAKGPLQLAEGEYCCTLESVGSPLAIPKEYARTETTPLKFSRSEDKSELRLELPAALRQ